MMWTRSVNHLECYESAEDCDDERRNNTDRIKLHCPQCVHAEMIHAVEASIDP